MTNKRTVLVIDASQLSDFLFCPTYWYYRHIRCLGAPKVKVGEQKLSPSELGIERGTLIHNVLDAYYRNVPKMGFNAAFGHASNLFENFAEKSRLTKEDKSLVRERLLQYYTFYGHGSRDFTPMQIAGNPQVEMGFAYPIVDTPSHLFVIEGRTDLITNQGIFVDHKSQSQFKMYGRHNIQFKIYSLAMKLKQVCINCIGMQQKFDKDRTLHRQMFAYNRVELQLFEVWLKRKMFEMASALQSGYLEQNEANCHGAYKTGPECVYANPCHALSPEQKDAYERLQLVKIEKWTPWKLEDE